MLSRTITSTRRSWPNVRLPRRPGGVEFKVRWRGYGPSHDTSEPVSSFELRIGTPFMQYVRRHKTKLQVSDFEALTRAIEAMGN